MPARPRGSARGTFRRIPSAIRKMDKRKKTKTPPPPRISARTRSNPPSRSRSSRPARDTTLPRSSPRSPKRRLSSPRSPKRRLSSPRSPKRRLSSPPGKNVVRKPREDLRSSIEPKRTADAPKNRERTPEKKYVEKLPYEELKEHQGPSYTKEAIKKINIRVPNYYKEKFLESNYDPNPTFNKTFNPEIFTVVRQPGEGSVPIFDRLRKFDEYDEGPSHSDRFDNSNSYNDNIRESSMRQYFIDKEKERSVHHSRRSPREDYEYRDDSRYQPSTSTRRSRSFDRSKDYHPERKDRYDERNIPRGPRRSLERDRERERERDRVRDRDKDRERDRDRDGDRDRDRDRDRERERDRDRDRDRERDRDRDRDGDRDRDRNRGRSDERVIRRQSSLSPRRQYRDYEERRQRSLERRSRTPMESRRRRSLERRDSEPFHFRDREYPSRSEQSIKSRGYYENNRREKRSLSPRGRGGVIHCITRGVCISGPPPFIRLPAPAVRAMRGGPMPMPRCSLVGRRLPYPSRKSFRGSLQGRLNF